MVHFCVWVVVLLGASTLAQPCPTNPVMGVVQTNEGTCEEGTVNIAGDLGVIFDTRLGTNTSNTVHVSGVLSAADIQARADDVTVRSKTSGGSVVVQVEHAWNNYPESDTGQFEVRDGNGTVAFEVNNWGTTVFKRGTMLQGGLTTVNGSATGVFQMTADMVAGGHTFYRALPGVAGFDVRLPPAVEFQELMGVAGTPCLVGVRFPPITIINLSPTQTITFSVPSTVYWIWSPWPKDPDCATKSICRIYLTTVAATSVSVTFMVEIHTASAGMFM